MPKYEYQLVWQDAPGGAMRAYTVQGGDLRLGRSSKCDIVIVQPEVSRAHARLFWQDDGYWVEDLSSTNGTWLNGRRLPPHEPAPLKPGDVIGLGPNVRLEFHVLEIGVEPTQAVPMTPEGAEEEPEDDENFWSSSPWEGEPADEAAEAPPAPDQPAASAAPQEEVRVSQWVAYAAESEEHSESAGEGEDAAVQAEAEAGAPLPPAEAALGSAAPPRPPAPEPAAARQPQAPQAAPRPAGSAWRYLLTGCALGAVVAGCAVSGFLLWVDANALWCQYFAWLPFFACP